MSMVHITVGPSTNADNHQLPSISGVTYGNDHYLLAQSTKFGTHVLWAKAKLFGVHDFEGQGHGQDKVKGQTSLIAVFCHV